MSFSYFMLKKGVFCKVQTNSDMYIKMKKNNAIEVSLPSVTVSIPVYKTKNLVKRAVTSILRQTYPNFNLIVVSDADPDDSVEKIRGIRDDRLKIVELKKNIGRYSIDHLVVNCMTTSDFWVPVDSDDWCEETFLSKMVMKQLEFPMSDVIFAGQTSHSGYAKKRTHVKQWDGSSNLVWHAHMSALWRREFVIESNLTNPNFRIGWDSMMTSAPWLLGVVNVLNEHLYHRVKRSSSLTSSVETGFGSDLRNRVKTYITALWKEMVEAQDIEKVKQILLRSRNEQY